MIDDLEVVWYGEGEDVYETVLGDAMLGDHQPNSRPGLYGDALLFNASMDNALPLTTPTIFLERASSSR